MANGRWSCLARKVRSDFRRNLRPLQPRILGIASTPDRDLQSTASRLSRRLGCKAWCWCSLWMRFTQ